MPLLARRIVFGVSFLDALLQHLYDGGNDLPSYVSSKHRNFSEHQARARREEFSGSSKTGYSKRAFSKAIVR
jgi:hypothetical protein